jgi:hypothetical protein
MDFIDGEGSEAAVRLEAYFHDGELATTDGSPSCVAVHAGEPMPAVASEIVRKLRRAIAAHRRLLGQPPSTLAAHQGTGR